MNSSQVLPPLREDEYVALKRSIQENGVLVPIECDEQGNVLDGHHRFKACRELGIKDWPRIVRKGMMEEESLEHVLTLNLDRRHLTPEERDNVIRQVRSRGLSVRSIAQVMHVGVATVHRAISAGVPSGTPATVRGTDGKRHPAQRERALCAPPLGVHFSSETAEWCTPGEIIERVQRVLGAIDLDPCSDSRDAPHVPAQEHYTREDDGLAHLWRGRVYLNPPYGRELPAWIDKLLGEYGSGRIAEAIALLPARTDTQWFRKLRSFPRCFLWGRLRFSEASSGAPFPSMIVYVGDRWERFVEVFSDIGDVYALVELPGRGSSVGGNSNWLWDGT